MKHLLTLVILLTLAQASIAQSNEIGIKTGVIGMDGTGDWGYNIEFNYERKIERFPILSIGIDMGFGKQNDFPDYFDKSFMFAENNDVSTKVDEHIRSLSAEEIGGLDRKSVV